MIRPEQCIELIMDVDAGLRPALKSRLGTRCEVPLIRAISSSEKAPAGSRHQQPRSDSRIKIEIHFDIQKLVPSSLA